MKTNLGAILIVLFLAFGAFNAARTTHTVTVPPEPPAIVKVEPAPAREQSAPAPAVKRVVAPAREQVRRHPKKAQRAYKGFTCGDVRRMVEVNGEDGAKEIARRAGATEAELKLAERCLSWGIK